ncbi:MAG: hypothetical protein KA239_02400 [Bacteroidia bacterium]|nr:hypothetical protein [Bacteroidia bacterium]
MHFPEIAFMPCPPSYEEQRFMSLDFEVESLEKSIKQQLKEIPDTLSLSAIFAQQAGTPEFHEDLGVTTRNLKRLQEEAAGLNFFWELYPKGWPEMDDVQRYEAFAAGLRKPNQEIELALCVTRTLLYKHRMMLLDSNAFLDAKTAQTWQKEVDRHTQHREADRTAAIQNVQPHIQYHERTLNADPSPTQRESATQLLKDLKIKVKQILAIPIEALLADRGLL